MVLFASLHLICIDCVDERCLDLGKQNSSVQLNFDFSAQKPNLEFCIALNLLSDERRIDLRKAYSA